MTIALLGVTACEAKPDHALGGKWTPVSVNDCSSGGQVVEFRRDVIFYQAGTNGAPIAKITGFSEPSPGVVHLTVRPHTNNVGEAEKLAREEIVRFEVGGGAARVTGESFDGGKTFAPMTAEGMTDIFTIKRCG